MIKRFFIIVSVIFALLFISSVTFATNNTVLTNITDGAVNGTSGLVNDFQNGVQNGMNSIQNGINGTNNNAAGNTDNVIGNTGNGIMNSAATTVPNNYGTARTATELTGTTTASSNVVTWIILAIAAIVIGALIWYYATQDTRVNRD